MEKATKLTPYEKSLKKALEERGYIVDVYDEPVSQHNKHPRRYAELEKHSDAGIDNIIVLEPFTIDSFEEYYNDYDIDKEIDLHRESESFRKAFSIRMALDAFEGWERLIKKDYDFLSEHEDEIIAGKY